MPAARVSASTEPDRERLLSAGVRGAGWITVQSAGSRLASLLTFVVLGRLLGPEEFGLVSMAVVVTGALTTLLDASLQTYLVQQRELRDRTVHTAFWSSVTLGVLCAAAATVAAPAVSSGVFDEPALAPVLVAMAWAIPLAAVSAVPQGLLVRALRYRMVALRGVVGTVASGAVGIGLALSGAGVWALVAQVYTQNLVTIVLFVGVAGWRPRLLWDRHEAGAMVRYGSTLWGIRVVSYLRRYGDELVIGAVLGAGTLGLYFVAKRILNLVMELSASVGGVFTSVMAAAKPDEARIRRGYVSGVAAAAALVTPVMLLLAVTSGVLVPLAFGGQWSAAGPVAQLLAVGAVVASLAFLDQGLFLALERPRAELLNVTVVIVASLGVVVVTAPFGLVPLAAATSAVALAAWGWRLVAAHRWAGVPARSVLARVLPVWAAGAVSAGAAWVASQAVPEGAWAVLLAGVVVAVLYPPLLWWWARPVVADLRRMLPVAAAVRRLAGRLPRRARARTVA